MFELIPGMARVTSAGDTIDVGQPYHGVRRLTAGSSNTLGFCQLAIRPGGGDWIATEVLIAKSYRVYRAPTADIIAAGRADSKSIYHQLWKLSTQLYAALRHSHDNTTYVSQEWSAFNWAGGHMPPVYRSTDSTYANSRQYLVCAHGGEHKYLIPYAQIAKSGGAASNSRMATLPAYDDTSCYVDIQDTGTVLGTDDVVLPGCFFLDEDTADATGLVALDTTAYAAQGHAIRPKEWRNVYDGLIRLKSLFEVEHYFHNGGHAYPISRLVGATQVYDGSVTVPSDVATLAYTATTMAAGSNTAAETAKYTAVRIDDATGKVYFPSFVGDSGSGIITVTIGVDSDGTYAILRRKTTGTVNTGNLRVWRVDP
jgi:hypothetical protein